MAVTYVLTAVIFIDGCDMCVLTSCDVCVLTAVLYVLTAR